jgi:hypothetical protein
MKLTKEMKTQFKPDVSVCVIQHTNNLPPYKDVAAFP